MSLSESPAEVASKKALAQMYECLSAHRNFRLEAGAGAGKTYSLVKALEFLIDRHSVDLMRKHKRIACITYTNVAKDQIRGRIDSSPVVLCETNHSFCWSLIRGFQKQLRGEIPLLPAWKDRITAAGGIGSQLISYDLGRRSLSEEQILLHHDDILPLTIRMMRLEKFRRLLAERFPIILIDEYQDTDSDWMDAIKANFLESQSGPLFGFFGDHWQRIYDDGCGKIEHDSVLEIGKKANFRSVQKIVDVLNKMRPELPQFVAEETAGGMSHIFLTNEWLGVRQDGSHWGGDLPRETAHAALEAVKTRLHEFGWVFSGDKTKILMLTHRVLGSEQGYSSLFDVFEYPDAFIKMEDPYVAFFVQTLEPACVAFENRRYGEMFRTLGGARPVIRRHSDKERWASFMKGLLQVRSHGTVGDVLKYVSAVGMLNLPDKVADLETRLRASESVDVTSPDLVRAAKLKDVKFEAIRQLRLFIEGHSPFATKHGVKGDEFENVLVVIGRGWNKYNVGEMLELANTKVPPKRIDFYERNRNLFYVACSRARVRLALLFTQHLSTAAVNTLRSWFGDSAVESLRF